MSNYRLANDILVYPVYNAFVIYPKNKPSIIIDNDVLAFLKSLSLETSQKSLEHASIEKLLNYGIIYESTPSDKRNPTIREYPVSEHILNKYKDDDYSWFEYIPSRLEIDLTNNCNFNCIHCSRDSGKSLNNELSLEQLINIFSEASELGILTLTLMGGEPLVRKDIKEILYNLQGKFYYVSIGTNGWLVKKYIKELAQSVNLVQVSLHGASADIHDKFVNTKGAFLRATDAIKMLQDKGLKVVVSHTITPENKNEYEKMFELAKKLEIEHLRFVRMAWVGRARNLNKLTWKDICAAEKSICNLAKTSNVDVEGGGIDVRSTLNHEAYVFGCSAGRSLMCINAVGDVILCPGIEEPIGNVSSSMLLDLWHSDLLVRSRKINDNCMGCKVLQRCSGTCRFGKDDPFASYRRPKGVKKCFDDPNLEDVSFN